MNSITGANICTDHADNDNTNMKAYRTSLGTVVNLDQTATVVFQGSGKAIVTLVNGAAVMVDSTHVPGLCEAMGLRYIPTACHRSDNRFARAVAMQEGGPCNLRALAHELALAVEEATKDNVNPKDDSAVALMLHQMFSLCWVSLADLDTWEARMKDAREKAETPPTDTVRTVG